MVEPEETVPVEHDHRKDGAKLDDDREGPHEGRVFHSQQVLGNKHVTRGGDGQKFCQALHDGNDDGLNQIHVGRYLFFFVIVVMGIFRGSP